MKPPRPEGGDFFSPPILGGVGGGNYGRSPPPNTGSLNVCRERLLRMFSNALINKELRYRLGETCRIRLTSNSSVIGYQSARRGDRRGDL